MSARVYVFPLIRIEREENGGAEFSEAEIQEMLDRLELATAEVVCSSLKKKGKVLPDNMIACFSHVLLRSVVERIALRST